MCLTFILGEEKNIQNTGTQKAVFCIWIIAWTKTPHTSWSVMFIGKTIVSYLT